jgi:PBSX family phage terminase large subunit
MEVIIERPIDDFKILYDLPRDTNIVICIGGRGGAKTYNVSQYVAVQATIKQKRCVILRDERELIRESILNEVLLRYDTANNDGYLDSRYERLSNGIKDKKTGEMLVFTKGFRASDLQKKANLKSISDIDLAIIEEAEDIRDVQKFNTFADSIRKEGSVIIIILNTPDINHWIIKRYFNLEQVEDGFYKIHPKLIKGFICIQTDYTKNPFLPQHIKDNYKGYGDINSHLYDPYYYKTAILGYASTGRKGQILTKVKPIKLADYMALPFKEYYGQDFGTAAPAGMIGVKFDKNNAYCRQINYMPMSVLSIAKLYCQLKLSSNDRIVVDYAEPEWKKLRDGFLRKDLSQEDIDSYPQLLKGFNVFPCKKGIDYGISLAKSMNIYAVEESKDLWNEILSRIYAQDKNGNYTNEPEPGYDHLQDPLLYVIVDQRGHKQAGDITVKSN